MRLTPVLNKFKRMFVGLQPKFRGSATSGKHKFVPPAHRGNRYMLWTQWKHQEEVMKYITKPYITADEEIDYLEQMGLKHQDVDPLTTCKLEPPMQQKYSTDVLELFDRNRKHEIWE